MPTVVRDLPPEEETPGVESQFDNEPKVFPPSVEDDEALARRLQAEWDASDAAASSSASAAASNNNETANGNDTTTPAGGSNSVDNGSSSGNGIGNTHSVATLSNAWEFDVDQRFCANCADEFHHFNRRHHCRLCGKIFCHRCSNQRALVPPSSIVLTPSEGGKKALPPSSQEKKSFTPDPDPDRMLTYIDEEKQLLYGKGLEER
jgi:hypothetical protein